MGERVCLTICANVGMCRCVCPYMHVCGVHIWCVSEAEYVCVFVPDDEGTGINGRILRDVSGGGGVFVAVRALLGDAVNHEITVIHEVTVIHEITVVDEINVRTMYNVDRAVVSLKKGVDCVGILGIADLPWPLTG